MEIPDYIFYELSPDADLESHFHEDPQGHQEYVMRPCSVTCKICGLPDLASERDLREKGWTLNRKGTFCPQH